MRGFCLNITVNPESIPNYVREILKYLREIPARFFLNKQCCNEELHIDQRNAFCQIMQRVPQRQSKILFLECRAELPGDRFRDLAGNHSQTGCKRMSRSNRTIEQIQSFREVLLETAQSLPTFDGHVDEWDYARRGGNKNRQWKSRMEEASHTEHETGQGPNSL